MHRTVQSYSAPCISQWQMKQPGTHSISTSYTYSWVQLRQSSMLVFHSSAMKFKKQCFHKKNKHCFQRNGRLQCRSHTSFFHWKHYIATVVYVMHSKKIYDWSWFHYKMMYLYWKHFFHRNDMVGFMYMQLASQLLYTCIRWTLFTFKENMTACMLSINV